MFKGSLDGEFWYRIDLEALNPEDTIFPVMECEVGRLEVHGYIHPSKAEYLNVYGHVVKIQSLSTKSRDLTTANHY